MLASRRKKNSCMSTWRLLPSQNQSPKSLLRHVYKNFPIFLRPTYKHSIVWSMMRLIFSLLRAVPIFLPNVHVPDWAVSTRARHGQICTASHSCILHCDGRPHRGPSCRLPLFLENPNLGYYSYQMKFNSKNLGLDSEVWRFLWDIAQSHTRIIT